MVTQLHVEMKKKKLHNDFMAIILYERMGYDSAHGAKEFIRLVKNGDFWYKRQYPQKDDINLAILAYAVGLPEDNPRVIKLKEKGLYPPENGIDYATIKKIQDASKNKANAEILKGLENKLSLA